ncbi:MAG: LLM class flavin-dependent oxidoreductase [Myxococcota bacterium]
MEFGLMSLGDHLPDPHSGDFELDQAGRHRSFVEQAVFAEELGFYSVHLGEHHFSDYILASPPVVLAAIAERTRSLRLSTAVTLATHLDPLRLAEDYATLDLLSGGRLEIVMGRGGFTRAYEVFGQSLADSRAVYDESVALVKRVLEEEAVTCTPRFRPPLHEVTVQPRPFQRPHPPIWIAAGSSDASFDLAAELGLHLMVPTIFGPASHFSARVARYRDRIAAAGHAPEQARVATSVHTYVCKDSQDAKTFWRPYYANYLDWVGGVLRAQAEGPEVDTDVESLIHGPAMCGSPAQVVDQLGELADELQMDLHLAMFDLGGLPEIELRRSMELFGTRVMPEFGAPP